MSQSDLPLLSAQKEQSLVELLCSQLDTFYTGLVAPVEVRINGLSSGCFVLVYDSQIFLSSPPRVIVLLVVIHQNRKHRLLHKCRNSFRYTRLSQASRGFFTSKCVSCIRTSTRSCFDKTFTILQRTCAPCEHQQNLAKHNVGS
jgi:hypothetical protein